MCGPAQELPGETQRFRPFGRTILQGGETVCVWSKEECTLSYEEFKTAFGSGDQQSVYIKADLVSSSRNIWPVLFISKPEAHIMFNSNRGK